MQKIVLDNGLTLLLYKKPTSSITIQATIKVGSNHENNSTRGISHFIEHLLFEGTKTRSPQEIASSIEGVGGDFGAFTSNTRTAYYIKVLKRFFPIAADVLSDMVTNPSFDKKIIEKERNIILSEIKMREDEPRSYLWQLLEKTLYKKHPAKHPIIGYEKNVKSISREDIISFFKKTYAPNNIIISLTGSFTNKDISTTKKLFSNLKTKPIPTQKETKEPSLDKNRVSRISKDIQQTYIVFGYHALPKLDKDAPIFDVIQAILGRPLSGRLFRDIRQDKGLCYDVGAHYEDEIGYGFFAVYVSTEKKKESQAESLILKHIKNVDKISQKELKEVKQYLEGDYLLDLEDTQKLADELTYWEYAGDKDKILSYIDEIKKVTKDDITRIKNKFLNCYAKAAIEQKHP